MKRNYSLTICHFGADTLWLFCNCL